MAFIEEFITGASFMNLSYTGNILSTFINNDALPTGAPGTLVTYMTNFPNGNYASESHEANLLNDFLIGQTRSFVTADATDIVTNFNNLMSDLFHSLQACWYIDADGKFRIEHVEFFERMVSESTALDLTAAAYDKYKSETDAREMSFNKSALANREQFSWQQTGTVTDSQDFIGVDIIYDNLETVSNVVKHEPRSVTTDLQYLVSNPGDGSASGLMYLLGIELTGGDYYIDFETGVLSTTKVLNGHFSWANLQDKYWTWRRMSENGSMNAGGTPATIAFDSAVKFLEQSNVRFGYQTTLDGFKKITTIQGTGQQLETVRDLATDFITMTIAYNPYA